MGVEEYIPEGYENRKSRWELMDILHEPDRMIRKRIAEAQQNGVLIISIDGGYFQPGANDGPYVAEYMAKERHRFTQQARKLKALSKASGRDSKDIPGQMTFTL